MAEDAELTPEENLLLEELEADHICLSDTIAQHRKAHAAEMTELYSILAKLSRSLDSLPNYVSASGSNSILEVALTTMNHSVPSHAFSVEQKPILDISEQKNNGDLDDERLDFSESDHCDKFIDRHDENHEEPKDLQLVLPLMATFEKPKFTAFLEPSLSERTNAICLDLANDNGYETKNRQLKMWLLHSYRGPIGKKEKQTPEQLCDFPISSLVLAGINLHVARIVQKKSVLALHSVQLLMIFDPGGEIA